MIAGRCSWKTQLLRNCVANRIFHRGASGGSAEPRPLEDAASSAGAARLSRGEERTGPDGILTRGAEQLRQILLPESALPHSGTAADLRAVDVQGQVLFIDDGVRRPVSQRQLAALVDVRIPDRSYNSHV